MVNYFFAFFQRQAKTKARVGVIKDDHVVVNPSYSRAFGHGGSCVFNTVSGKASQ